MVLDPVHGSVVVMINAGVLTIIVPGVVPLGETVDVIVPEPAHGSVVVMNNAGVLTITVPVAPLGETVVVIVPGPVHGSVVVTYDAGVWTALFAVICPVWPGSGPEALFSHLVLVLCLC
jgi:hypothetical protein